MARTGRPREFDRDQAVHKAMILFWDQGYEPTSLSQLKEAMGGISPASFYAAFGSKEGLFEEAVQHYLETHGQATVSLKDPSLPPREAIELALRRSAKMQTDSTHPPGCLVVLGASNCALENRHVDALLARERATNRRGIEACIRRGIDSGELSSSANVSALATMFDMVLLGIAFEAKDGARFSRLDAAVTAAMSVWDAHRAPKKT